MAANRRDFSDKKLDEARAVGIDWLRFESRGNDPAVESHIKVVSDWLRRILREYRDKGYIEAPFEAEYTDHASGRIAYLTSVAANKALQELGTTLDEAIAAGSKSREVLGGTTGKKVTDATLFARAGVAGFEYIDKNYDLAVQPANDFLVLKNWYERALAEYRRTGCLDKKMLDHVVLTDDASKRHVEVFRGALTAALDILGTTIDDAIAAKDEIKRKR